MKTIFYQPYKNKVYFAFFYLVLVLSACSLILTGASIERNRGLALIMGLCYLISICCLWFLLASMVMTLCVTHDTIYVYFGIFRNHIHVSWDNLHYAYTVAHRGHRFLILSNEQLVEESIRKMVKKVQIQLEYKSTHR